jgi:signal transduction histidine kinase
LFVRAQRELVQSLRDRADRLESEQRLRVEQAREAERLRIAREMHDVLAHRISLLSLHAGALEFRPDAPPDEVAEAAGVIRASAHAALEELREVIGVLREGVDEGTPPEPPQPTLAQIPALVDESRAAGMRVVCRIEAPGADALPAALGRTAYRVVQEGLTNARKHAPAASVEVTVAAQAGPRLVVEVLSRRPVGVVATAALAGAGAGAGLIGLAERVALAGGELEHGPDAAGDFVLRATLPWQQ